jgi:hypothetical protein
MRRIALFMTFVSVAACSFDSGGHIAGGEDSDADVVFEPDGSTPDAGPACISSAECATPPSLCKLPGTCDPDSNTCVYPSVDCSSEGDQCNNGVCDGATGNCVQAPAFEGEDCGGVTTCGGFSGCEFDPADVCDEAGTKSRTCTDFTCQAGACVGADRNEEEACSRDTDGDTCGGTTCGGFGGCTDFSDVCDESGMRYRDCTRRECGGGACTPIDFTDGTSCNRGSTDGTHCAEDDCGAFTSCQFSPSNMCDETGIKARVCTPFVCFAEACVDDASFTDTVGCTRDTGSVVCDSICEGPPGMSVCTDVECLDGECPTGG